MSVNVDVGPIDYLALEFPGARLTGEGMAILVDLVDRGIIRVLDMKALVRADDGTVTAVAISDLDGDGTLDLAVFEGVESDLLDEDDLKEAASLVEPGNAVALLVYENTWAGPFVSAMRRAGAEVVASVRIPADAVIARLEALEAAEASAGAARARRRAAITRRPIRTSITYVRRSTRWDSSVEWPGQPSSPGRPRRCRTGCRAVRPGAGQRRGATTTAATGVRARAGAVPAPPPPPQDTGVDLDKLKQLGELRDSGVLTEAEFQTQKARILAG